MNNSQLINIKKINHLIGLVKGRKEETFSKACFQFS
mgnify:CR=1 FL=1